MVAITSAPKEYDSSAARSWTPRAKNKIPIVAAVAVGIRNCLLRFATDARRPAINGPMPVNNSSRRPSGMLTVLKKGGPTVILLPRTASLMIGNSVPHNTENAIPTSTRLLYRNAASRLIMLSSSAVDLRSWSLVETRYAVTAIDITRNAANHFPTGDCANEWTLEITPLRVMKVPNIDSRNADTTSVTFHLRSMPRFSWTMIECRNAVLTSHGSSDAFSTGSHAQYPPQPSSTYAHHIPSTMPTVLKNHANSAHRRTAASHSASRRRVSNAAIANAKGIDVPT